MKLLVVVLLAFPSFATAIHALPTTDACSPGRGLGEIEVTAGSAQSTYYVDERDVLAGDSFWLYEESNGVWSGRTAGVYAAAIGGNVGADLQRGGNSVYVPGDFDSCRDVGDWAPDTLIF
jgi:hypothetical protein